MSRKHLVLAFAAVAITGHRSEADQIVVDLGPPTNVRIEAPGLRIRVPGLDGFPLTAHTSSFDITFANNQFVRLLAANHALGLDASLFLQVTGMGTLIGPTGEAYTVDSAGNRNSAIQTFAGGGVITGGVSTFNFGLGFVFPLDANPFFVGFPFDFYGLHVEFTLPNEPDFQLTGDTKGYLLLGGDASGPFVIGPHVSDNGRTLEFLALALMSLLIVKTKLRFRASESFFRRCSPVQRIAA